jgi:hypothetical protein
MRINSLVANGLGAYVGGTYGVVVNGVGAYGDGRTKEGKMMACSWRRANRVGANSVGVNDVGANGVGANGWGQMSEEQIG